MKDITTRHLIAFAMACTTWAYVVTQMSSCTDNERYFWMNRYKELKQAHEGG